MVSPLGLEFMPEKWDCRRMDYNSHNGEHPHGHQNHHRRSGNQSFSSVLLAAICKSTEDDGGTEGYKKSRSQVEMRNMEVESNRLAGNSRIEGLWDEEPWLTNEKSMRGRSAKMGVFNSEKYEAEAENTKRRSEFHLPFHSNMSSAPSCSSDYTSNTASISCPYLSLDAESLYTHTSSIPTANETQRNSYHVACRGDGAYKWAVGGECSGEFHWKSSFGDGNFRSTEKLFIPADHHTKIKSKSKTGKESKKPKQPISPGRKLANFFNSLFMAGGTKKTNLSSSFSVSDSNSYDSSQRKSDSVYLSSSSVKFKSCLRNAPRGSNNTNDPMSQKSVTFYPSVIVDENSRPCGEKCLQNMEKDPQITHIVPNPNPSSYPHITHPSADAYKLLLHSKGLKKHIVEEESHAAAAATAKEIIAKYQKTSRTMETVVIRDLDKADEGGEEDNDWSCSSSDLFELENLAAIDMNMDVYQKELPVFETTNAVTNKTIANGLICDYYREMT